MTKLTSELGLQGFILIEGLARGELREGGFAGRGRRCREVGEGTVGEVAVLGEEVVHVDPKVLGARVAAHVSQGFSRRRGKKKAIVHLRLRLFLSTSRIVSVSRGPLSCFAGSVYSSRGGGHNRTGQKITRAENSYGFPKHVQQAMQNAKQPVTTWNRSRT